MDNVQGDGPTILGNDAAIIDISTTLIVGTPSQVSTRYSVLGGTVASST